MFASTEDEIASVQAGQISSTPELWVAGTSMTLLTVDAKLMPILPLIARPESKRALVVAFGMGTAFRSALIAGLRTDVVELVPSVPDMFGWYYADADAVLRGPERPGHHRRRPEPPRARPTEQFDIIVTDPPPPIESSGASVISSLEYYQAGHDHLTPGGVMMQWVPFGGARGGVQGPRPDVRRGLPERRWSSGAPAATARTCWVSDEPLSLDRRRHPRDPRAARACSRTSRPPTTRRRTTVEDWISVIARQQWLAGTGVTDYAGPGPLITDDHPRPEYFLLRRLFGLR